MKNKSTAIFLALVILGSIFSPYIHASKPSTLKGIAKIVGGCALIAASGVATFQLMGSIIENQAIKNGKYQRLVGSDIDKAPHWSHAFLPLAIIPGFILGGSLLNSGWNEIPKYPFFSFNKQQLTDAIKADLYKVFTQEMWIVSKDFAAMAQGNAELEQDLKDLYASFADSEDTQKKLDAFCKKWKLDPITIAGN